jgi:hypothetical protein
VIHMHIIRLNKLDGIRQFRTILFQKVIKRRKGQLYIRCYEGQRKNTR